MYKLLPKLNKILCGQVSTDPNTRCHLVQWRFNLLLSSEPVYAERERRLWRQFNLANFRNALTSSCLCDPATYDKQSDVNLLTQTFNETAEKLLDAHAPWSKVTCCVRRKTDPWYDNDCRAAKRRARKLERRYKRWKSDYARSVWLQSLRDSHKLVDRKRSDYWRAKVESATSAKELWQAVDTTFCRDRPANVKSTRTANDLADFFESKVASIRAATDGAPPPTFTDWQSQSSLHVFKPLCQEDVVKLYCLGQAVQSRLNANMATERLCWLACAVLDSAVQRVAVVRLRPRSVQRCVHHAITEETGDWRWCSGKLSTSVKSVCLVKDAGTCNLNLISESLDFFRDTSQLIERAIRQKRPYKVCFDLTDMMDSGHHALLALLDSSAHQLSVPVIWDTWWRFELDAQLLVRPLLHCAVWGTESSSRRMLYGVQGVPERSVLGPLLFVLYTANVGGIANKHGMNSHFCADDAQLYTCHLDNKKLATPNKI